MKKRGIPILLPVSAALFFLSALLYALSIRYRPVANFAEIWLCRPVRRVFAFITGAVPFSVGETLLLALPFLVTLAVVFSYRYATDGVRRVRLLSVIVSVLLLVFSLYPYTLGIAYRTDTLPERLGIGERESDAGTLAAVSAYLLEKTAECAPEAQEGGSRCPLSLAEISEQVGIGYSRLVGKYPSVADSFPSVAKTVFMREAMSEAHLLGMYSFFSGEANVNDAPPDYILPFTVAHEFAHQRGVAREDEANFTAFLACVECDDPYIRYSGYLNLLEYVADALYTADPDAYRAHRAQYPPAVRADQKAYSAYYRQYSHAVLAGVSESMNDAYLQWNGTEGTASYGLVVDLAVAFFAQ